MKSFLNSLRRGAIVTGVFALALTPVFKSLSARADDAPTSTNSTVTASDDAADKAWKEVQKSMHPPMPPVAWQTNEPTQAEVARFYIPLMVAAADKAKDFYTRFPNSPKVAEARKSEFQVLSLAAARFGDTSQAARLAALEKEHLKDPNLDEDEKFQIRIADVRKSIAGLPGTRDELLKKGRALVKDFPQHEEGYQVLLIVLNQMGDNKDNAKAIVSEILANTNAPDQVELMAKGLLKQLDAIGKPVNIKFAAFDGRAVDVSQMKGKVILVDFWATWCGPCMAELPNVKAAYAKLHDKGFEIVGISSDDDKDALTKTLKENGMTWPQYFDGQGPANKFAAAFDVNAIPAMWLVDKKGNLRDINARGELEEKVTKLLAE